MRNANLDRSLLNSDFVDDSGVMDLEFRRLLAELESVMKQPFVCDRRRIVCYSSCPARHRMQQPGCPNDAVASPSGILLHPGQMGVKAKITVKNAVCCRRRLSRTGFLTVILALTLKSGAALRAHPLGRVEVKLTVSITGCRCPTPSHTANVTVILTRPSGVALRSCSIWADGIREEHF